MMKIRNEKFWPSGQGRELARPLGILFVPLLISVMSLSFSLSCSPGGGKADEGTSTADVQSARDAAVNAKEEAQKAKADNYFKENYDKALSYIEQGDELFAAQENAKAKLKFGRASREFSKLEKSAAEVNKISKEVAAAQKEVEKTKRQVLRTKANELAKREFEDAEAFYKKILDAVNSKDTTKLKSAKRGMDEASLMFKDVLRVAKENYAIREKAVAEQKAMLEQKKNADEAEAGKYAPQEYLHAEVQERSAGVDLEAGNFRRAYDTFKVAVQAFATAAQRSKEVKELAVIDQPANDTSAEPDTEAVSGEIEIDFEADDVGAEEIAEVSNLSDTDLLLQENIDKLAVAFSEGSTFDAQTGEVVLDYTFGHILEKDLIKIGRWSDKYIWYRDPMTDARSARQDAELAISFHGNTGGYFLLPVPLKGKIKVEYTVALGVMDRNGNMGPVFYADRRGGTFWWADFLTFRRYRDGRQSGADIPEREEFKGDPNYWFDKTTRVPMRIETIADPKEPDENHLVAYYHLFEHAEPLNASPRIDADESGYFGFRWSRTKFNIYKLKITGTLDKKEALKLLEEKGIKVDSEEK